jgi:solute carrier family 25 carnitine/acylcarnitine transporter 20/29
MPNDYINGIAVGISQTLIGHPFDTIKTNMQFGGNKVKYHQLLNGIKFPLMSSVLGNVVLFGNYEKIYSYTNSSIISGSLSGLIGSVILNPFEARKVRHQSLTKDKNTRKVNSIFLGLKYTMARESVSNIFYFTTYDILHNNYNVNAFLAGGCSGINSWLFSYPLDVIKTRKQLNPHLSFNELLVMGNYSRGLMITLIRGFLVNGFSFYIYDIIKRHNT